MMPLVEKLLGYDSNSLLFTEYILVNPMPGCDIASSRLWTGMNTETQKRKRKPARRKSVLGKDKRRKHRHWQVTVYYQDGEKFARVYIDRAKALLFAERQKKSPVVRATRVRQVN
ncbi:MAG: hypothetical protein K6U02_09865 [Firmicutes bacterium]|nr:hypothetical protein [Bacillota bacterium]